MNTASVEQVADQILASPDGRPIYIGDVAEVKLGFAKPSGFVRGYGIPNIAVNCQRETGANVMDVMERIRETIKRLNDGILKREGLVLTQVYDETEYISSAIGLVNQNIILGSALTVVVLMIFLHFSWKALFFVPLLAASSVAALSISPWFFLVTLGLILIAGFWFARGTLVIALAIPTSIVGTFLVLNLLDRSLNVISLAGLAFAVGMLVDNAVVVLENVVRFYQKGHPPFEAARLAALEVWGAVLASTLTTLAVFLPIIFLEGEAGSVVRRYCTRDQCRRWPVAAGQCHRHSNCLSANSAKPGIGGPASRQPAAVGRSAGKPGRQFYRRNQRLDSTGAVAANRSSDRHVFHCDRRRLAADAQD